MSVVDSGFIDLEEVGTVVVARMTVAVVRNPPHNAIDGVPQPIPASPWSIGP